MATGESQDGIGAAAEAAELVQRLREEGIPRRRQYSLQAQEGGVNSTLMRDALEDAGIDIEDPGHADQFYFEHAEMLVIDLGNAESNGED